MKAFISTLTLSGALLAESVQAQDIAMLTESVSEKVMHMTDSREGELSVSEQIEKIREKLPKKWKIGELVGDMPEEDRMIAQIDSIGNGKFVVRHQRIGMITADDIVATPENGIETSEIKIEFSGLAIAFQHFHPFLSRLNENESYELINKDGLLEFKKKESH